MKIGIDVGGSHIGIGLVDNNGQLLKKEEIDINMSKEEKLNIVEYIKNVITDISKGVEIEMIGIGAPGTPVDKKITNLTNFNVDEIDFKILEKSFPGTRVKIMNDAKVAALAEKEYGSMKGYEDGVFLCFGTGVGGAVFYNNNLVIPKRYPGMEIGHMIIHVNGEKCNCGKSGCFEKYCSIKKYRETVQAILEKQKGEKVKTSQDFILELEANKDNLQIKMYTELFIENLIIGLSNIIDIFEPQVIVLGGSFVYYKNILFKEAVKRLKEKRYVFNKENIPEIVLADLKNDSGIIGATLIP